MRFAEIIFKNIRRRRTRAALTAAGLAVAVMAIAALWNIAWGYAHSTTSFYANNGVDVVVVRAGVSDRLTSNLRSTIAAPIASLPGVGKVDGSLTELVSVGNSKLFGVPLRGLDFEGFTMTGLVVGDGRKLLPTDHHAVLLGNGIAMSLGKRPGQKIEIEGDEYEILGILQSTNPYEANSVVAPLGDVQTLMDRGTNVSEFQIQVDKSVESNDAIVEICHAIESLRDDQGDNLGLKAQPTHDFVATTTEAILGDAMAWGTSLIVIVLSIIGMLNTMLMSVLERTRELGLLRAVGWTRSRIMRMILGESIVIGLVAAVIGLVAAELLMRALSRYPDTSAFVPANLSGTASILGALAAILAGMVGALVPALRAANVPPVAALRHE